MKKEVLKKLLCVCAVSILSICLSCAVSAAGITVEKDTANGIVYLTVSGNEIEDAVHSATLRSLSSEDVIYMAQRTASDAIMVWEIEMPPLSEGAYLFSDTWGENRAEITFVYSENGDFTCSFSDEALTVSGTCAPSDYVSARLVGEDGTVFLAQQQSDALGAYEIEVGCAKLQGKYTVLVCEGVAGSIGAKEIRIGDIYHYDLNNRLISVEKSDGSVINFTYDNNGNLTAKSIEGGNE